MIDILFVGSEKKYSNLIFPRNVNVRFNWESDKLYDVTILSKTLSWGEAYDLHKHIKAYTLYALSYVEMNEATDWLIKARKGKTITKEDLQLFLDNKVQLYYPNPYGEKFRLNDIHISQNFNGKVNWYGQTYLELNGIFGNDFNQTIFWRNNIPIFKFQSIEFWLEYEKSDNVEIMMEIVQMRKGTVSEIQKKWCFSEIEMSDMVYIENKDIDSNLFISIFAKGEGTLKIKGLHDRYSRKGEGMFLPGGVRKITSKREEVFFYYDPGMMKPPLNIYFSGYKTLEGFEGYNMMRSLGSPFLLISESRLEGGAFYIGDDEYNSLIISEINRVLRELNFKNSDVIFSGLSMGSYGALLYSCYFKPYAVVVGKPLINIGNIAKNGRLKRPGVFSTSLDVLYKNYGNLDDRSIESLNDYFWNIFIHTDWSNTKLIISYMIEDDYDSTAYKDILEHCSNYGIMIIGKGLHGRHNDNTGGIVSWFYKQLENIMLNEFNQEDNHNGN